MHTWPKSTFGGSDPQYREDLVGDELDLFLLTPLKLPRATAACRGLPRATAACSVFVVCLRALFVA
eukprot:3361972-Prymnesium_polylepis.1